MNQVIVCADEFGNNSFKFSTESTYLLSQVLSLIIRYLDDLQYMNIDFTIRDYKKKKRIPKLLHYKIKPLTIARGFVLSTQSPGTLCSKALLYSALNYFKIFGGFIKL
jgi:hypothetical protein